MKSPHVTSAGLILVSWPNYWHPPVQIQTKQTIQAGVLSLLGVWRLVIQANMRRSNWKVWLKISGMLCQETWSPISTLIIRPSKIMYVDFDDWLVSTAMFFYLSNLLTTKDIKVLYIKYICSYIDCLPCCATDWAQNLNFSRNTKFSRKIV